MRTILIIWKIFLLLFGVLGGTIVCKEIYFYDGNLNETLQGLLFFAAAFTVLTFVVYRIKDFSEFLKNK